MSQELTVATGSTGKQGAAPSRGASWSEATRVAWRRIPAESAPIVPDPGLAAADEPRW